MRTHLVTGCFDGFHPGHQYFLKEAHKKADVLFVLVNTDDYIRRTKHCEPIQRLAMRISIVRRYARKVIAFDTDSPLYLIERINPDLILAGSDYCKQDVVGYGRFPVKIIPRLPNHSSTTLRANKYPAQQFTHLGHLDEDPQVQHARGEDHP